MQGVQQGKCVERSCREGYRWTYHSDGAEVASQTSLCGCLVLIVCREISLISLMGPSESPGVVVKFQLNTKGSDTASSQRCLSHTQILCQLGPLLLLGV